MDVSEIKTLIDAMAVSDIADMEVSRDGWTLRLSRGFLPAPAGQTPVASAPPAPSKARLRQQRPTAPDRTDETSVAAPLAGIVYLAPSPATPAFVSLGQAVQPGMTVCVIEAMKVFVEVRAERAGRIDAICVTTGDEVDAGQPLFRIV